MKATVYRYNSKKRGDRKFNDTGREKNPNNVKFYALDLNYADKYKFIYSESGEIDYECELEVANVAGNFFDMCEKFEETEAYKVYVNQLIGTMKKDYTFYLNNAKSKKDKDLFSRLLKNLENEEEAIKKRLFMTEFQSLSDYELQDILIAELREKGFDGYITKNEIAVF